MINTSEAPTQRLQLALNVKDLDEAVDFYTKMFATPPVKVRPGYANFAIANPPLKLVLFENGETGTINHLGVEVSTAEEVSEAEARITAAGINTTGVEETICCYAEKTETWLNGPDSTRWEWYVKTGDTDQMSHTEASTGDERNQVAACCSPEAMATTSTKPCC